MTLKELWVDYNIWGEIQTTGLPAHADGGSMGSGTPYLASPASHAAAYQDVFKRYRQPTRIRHSIAYSMISRAKAGTNPTEYELFLVVDPVVTLWNPFNIACYLPPTAFSTFQNWTVPYEMTLTVEKPPAGGNPGSTVTLAPFRLTDACGTGFNVSKVSVTGQPLVMRPGEVQVLSQSYRDEVRIMSGQEIDAKLG